ncbi:hypothetical protein ACEPAF_1912 [Sanghuangporus sanghuang]
MVSPFFFIKKEDGSLRAIQDYRKLNEGMVKNKYPLPLINELIDKGYYNIRIFMFFSLCNAPATFQGFMNDIFQELIHEGIVIIYLDDILIF